MIAVLVGLVELAVLVTTILEIVFEQYRESLTAHNQAIRSQEIESVGENVISVIANQKKMYKTLAVVQAAAGEQQPPVCRGALAQCCGWVSASM